MPGKEIKYYCNICQTEYCNERDAVNCEESHLIPEYVDCPNYSKFDGKRCILIPFWYVLEAVKLHDIIEKKIIK